MVVGGERSQDGLAGVVVVPDRGGEGEEALQDADGDAVGGVAAVAFEVELAFEGVVDGFDDLADGLSWRGAAPGSRSWAGRSSSTPWSARWRSNSAEA